MTIQDDSKIKDEIPPDTSLKINTIDEMKNLESEIQQSADSTFKKTTYWNQQKSGLGDSSREQISEITEHLERIQAQLEKMQKQLESMQDQSERIYARLEKIQSRGEKQWFL